MVCHNELCDGVADLSGKYSTTMHVHNNPLIFSGSAVQRPKAHPDGTTSSTSKNNPEATEYKGNLMIREFYQNGTGSAHDMRVVNTGAK